MTPATLVQSLLHRGVRLEADGARLHYVGPVTSAELDQLRQHKAEVLRLLTGGSINPTPMTKLPSGAEAEVSVPSGRCENCGGVLAYVEGWPSASEARWLCSTCASWPAPSLAEVFGTLTREEHGRLTTEAATGDGLAQLVVRATACTPEPAAWRLYSRRLARELWVARDATAAADLDRDGARDGLPVVLATDLKRLRSFDDQRLRDLLDVLAVFPGARVTDAEKELVEEQ